MNYRRKAGYPGKVPMSLPRVFLTKEQISDTAIIKGTDAHHLRNVLRLKPGDKIVICDMQRTEYECVISDIGCNGGSDIHVNITSQHVSPAEDNYETTLFQAVVKGDRFEIAVQKSTELGITRIVPVVTERCVARLNGDSLKSRLIRYERIAQSAAQQCGRGIIPQVASPIKYDEALQIMRSDHDCPFVCYEGDGTHPLRELIEVSPVPHKFAFLIGPEGGLSLREAKLATEIGIPLAGLGRRILRTETASSFVLSAISVLTCDKKM